jgi:2-iminoacetate synthase ThiH
VSIREPLVDGWGRAIGSVRISVTDRCNFRCRYCMPAEGLPWVAKDDLLSFEEIVRLVRVLAEAGVVETDLSSLMRGGASDVQLEQALRDAVARKLKHRIGDPGFQPASR